MVQYFQVVPSCVFYLRQVYILKITCQGLLIETLPFKDPDTVLLCPDKAYSRGVILY